MKRNKHQFLLNKKKLFSLNFKMIYVVVIALCIAVVTYFFAVRISDFLVEKYLFSASAIRNRARNYADSFENFVKKENVSSNDTQRILEWCKRQQYVYVMIYKDDQLIFSSEWWKEELDGGEELFEQFSVEIEEKEEEEEKIRVLDSSFFPLRFRDGVFAVSILDSSESKYRGITRYFSLATAMFLILIIILRYNHAVTSAVIQLSKKVNDVEQGDLTKEISLKRNDELAVLADDVNKMRISIIEQLQKEQKAWRANSELITSLSHDLRTPLTALMGYLDFLQGNSNRTEKETAQYLSVCQKKAKQIKELSDEMFQYFFVFGKDETAPNMEDFDAQVLLHQLLGENIILLQEKGFHVQMISPISSCHIKTDVAYLKRIFDNLFANINKHADISKEVIILVEEDHNEQNALTINFTNAIPHIPNRTESTKLGLRTCFKIAELLGISFEQREENNLFIVEMKIPIFKTR